MDILKIQVLRDSFASHDPKYTEILYFTAPRATESDPTDGDFTFVSVDGVRFAASVFLAAVEAIRKLEES